MKWISKNTSRSLPLSPLFKRLHVNIPTLSTQIGGKPSTDKEKYKLQPLLLNYYTGSIEKWVNKYLNQADFKTDAVGVVMYLIVVHLPVQIWLITSVLTREIFKGVVSTIEMVLVVIHQKYQKGIFNNGLPKSLLSKIWNIWQFPSLSTTKRTTIGILIEIMTM